MLPRLILVLAFFSVGIPKAIAAKYVVKPLGELLRVEANPREGFYFPFFLYVPSTKNKTARHLLLVPNNSGSSIKDAESQLQSAQREALNWGDLAEQTNSILLVSGFPRPDADPPLYTHALSKSSLEIKEGNLRRIDLQLIKMSEAARVVLINRGIKPESKVFLFGFSASAMFVNRFMFLHPQMTAAVAFGAPGGWPLAPVSQLGEKKLPYPVGLSGVTELVGQSLDLESAKKVPIFAFLGSKDDNDSVIFRDGYTKDDENLVFSMFGKTPVERWPAAEKLYRDADLNARFKLFDGFGHEMNRTTRNSVIEFFNSIRTR